MRRLVSVVSEVSDSLPPLALVPRVHAIGMQSSNWRIEGSEGGNLNGERKSLTSLTSPTAGGRPGPLPHPARREARREVAGKLAEAGLSQRQIGTALGVDQATVSRAMADANASRADDDSRRIQVVAADGDANASPPPSVGESRRAAEAVLIDRSHRFPVARGEELRAIDVAILQRLRPAGDLLRGNSGVLFGSPHANSPRSEGIGFPGAANVLLPPLHELRLLLDAVTARRNRP